MSSSCSPFSGATHWPTSQSYSLSMSTLVKPTPASSQVSPALTVIPSTLYKKSCVLPGMTYGAETWALTSHAKNRLAAAQTKMERNMLNITYRDRKTNVWVREKTKVTDVIEQVRRRKWTWAGHVSRIRDNRWTLRITTWKSYERKRPRGRPARCWSDELDDYWKGTIWQRMA